MEGTPVCVLSATIMLFDDDTTMRKHNENV